MNEEYSLTLTASPDPADVQAVREGLDAYDAEQGAPVDWVPLMAFMRDPQGTVVGGLTGGTYWRWLYVSRLWIEKRLRGQGYGSQILAEAEQEALRRGCHHAYLDTQDFSALPFYEKHGYIVYGVLNDMPVGHKRYSLEKRLGLETTRSANATRGTDSSVSLREITGETVVTICKLSDTLSAPQKKMVASNGQSIAQAHYNKYFWFRAVYADETPVGFLMLYDNPEERKYFLWRLMIAGPYQGLGYGKQAVQLLIEHVRMRPGAEVLLVSCGEGEASPEAFYARLGFQRTGEMLGDEVVMSLTLEP